MNTGDQPFTDEHGEFDLAVCNVCESAAATCCDTACAGVCGPCLVFCVQADIALQNTPGIANHAATHTNR